MRQARALVAYLIYYGYEGTVVDSQVKVPMQMLSKSDVEVRLVFFEGLLTYLRYIFCLSERRRYHRLQPLSYSVFPRVPRNFLRLNTGQLFLWLLIRKGVESYRLLLIHARGVQSTMVALPLKTLFAGLRVLSDVRGVESEEYAYAASDQGKYPLHVFQKKWLSYLEHATRTSLQMADYVSFVSQSMKHFLLGKEGNTPSRTAYIPCCVQMAPYDLLLKQREALRERFGFQGKVVFVYSGAVGKWHCTPLLPKLFAALKKIEPNSFFLGLTPSTKILTSLFVDQGIPSDSYLITQASFEDVPAYMMASDAGFLLREPHPLNKYSCPTKFAEYLAAGLFVLTTEAIDDIREVVVHHDVGMLLAPFDPMESLVSQLKPAVPKVLAVEERIQKSRAAAKIFDWSQYIPILEKWYVTSL